MHGTSGMHGMSGVSEAGRAGAPAGAAAPGVVPGMEQALQQVVGSLEMTAANAAMKFAQGLQAAGNGVMAQALNGEGGRAGTGARLAGTNVQPNFAIMA